MITKIYCGRTGQAAYEFDNGNVLSMVWSWGSYSDNNGFNRGEYTPPDFNKTDWESTTVEVYSMGKEANGLGEYLRRKYGDNPAGYVPVADIPLIIKRADRKPKENK